ncbi:MAG: FtsX-like permease family protein, partial [Bacilli bacterium]|nr:FtsX-like permease family protein [Bacilli bacterium]
IKSLKHKKLRLVSSILITSMTLMFLGLVFSLATFDVAQSEMNLLFKHNIDRVQIDKRHDTKTESFSASSLSQNDIEAITGKLDNDFFLIYKFNDSNTNYIQNALHIKMPTMDEDSNYYIRLTPIEIIELEQKSNISEQIIGSFPNNNNEILISNYLADLMIIRGVEVTDKNNKVQLFKPKNYEEIINSNYLFHLDELNNIKISGIIEYDLNEYNILKELPPNNENLTKYNDIIFDFSEKSEFIYNKIFVKKGFIEEYNQSISNNLDNNSQYELKVPSQSLVDPLFSQNKYGYLKQEIEYFDGEKWVITDKLNKNEVIFNISLLKEWDYNNYFQKLQDYYNDFPTRPKDELEKEFFVSYTSKYKDLIGKTVTLEITKNNEQTIDNLKIIGIIGLNDTYHQDKILFSQELLQDYVSSTFYTSAIFLNHLNSSELRKIIKIFPLGEKYAFNTIYGNKAYTSIQTINSFKKIAFYISLVFLFFSVLLISNFIITNINYKKKDIGILRALGARITDIIKIFLWEGLVLAITSVLFSSVMIIFASKWLNYWSFSSNPLILDPFIFTVNTFLFLLILVTIIVLIASIIPISKISKMKPVDAIFNR